MASRRPHAGDVFRIDTGTPRGAGYLQYTHDHEEYGELIRVLPGVHAEEPADLAGLVAGPTAFHVFFPLGFAARKGIVEFVGSFEVPEHARPFPMLRQGMPRKPPVRTWFLWDGKDHRQVNELTEEQKDWSQEELINDTMLIERLLQGWTPRRAYEGTLDDPPPPAAPGGDEARPVRHYVYASDAAAGDIARGFEQRGYAAEVRAGDEGEDALVLVTHDATGDVEAVERLALELGARYDGHEIPVS